VRRDEDTVKIAPSILAADFARLGEQVAEAERAGADRIHVDVMDGHFVPNLSMGAPIVASLRRVTHLSLETHLMISNPDFYLDEFVEAGSDSFLVHWEGNANLHRTVHRIRSLGKRVGVAINPATPAAVLEEILQEVDQVLVMTVDPGFGHQHFLHTTKPKIRRVRQMIERIKPAVRSRGGWRHRCGNGPGSCGSGSQRARGRVVRVRGSRRRGRRRQEPASQRSPGRAIALRKRRDTCS
jgi:ribulose-phosphate 3-epimerase